MKYSHLGWGITKQWKGLCGRACVHLFSYSEYGLNHWFLNSKKSSLVIKKD